MGDVPKKLPALNMAAAPTYTVPGGFHFNAQKVTFEILFSPESFDRFIDRLLPEVFPPDWAPQNEAEKEENLHRKFGGLGLDAQNLIRHSGITVNAPTVEISLRVDPRLTVRKGSAPDVYTLRAEERPGRRSHISFDAGRSSDASESESESESEFEFESGHVSTGPVAAMKGGLPSWERGGRYGARRAQSAAGDAGNNIFRETPALVAVGAQSIPANTVWPAVTEGVGTSGAGTRSLGVADTARRRSAPDVSVNSATSSQWVRTLSHDASRERRNSVDGGGSDASPLPSPLDATSLAASQSESLADEFIDLSLVGGHANAGLAATTQPGILAVNEEDSWTPGALSAASANAVNRSGGTQPAVAMPGGANREPIAPTFMPLNIVARASVAGEIGASRVPKYRDGALRERIKKQALAKVDLAMHPVIESVLAQLDLALPERRLRLKMKGVTPYEEALPEAGELVRNS